MVSGHPGASTRRGPGRFRQRDGAPPAAAASATCGAADTGPVPRSSRHRPGPQLRDLVQVSAGFDASRSPQPCYVLGCVDTAGTRTRTEVGGDLEAALRLLLQLGCPLRHAAWVRRGATLRLDRARDGGWQVTRYRPGPVPGAAGLTRQVRPGRRAEGDGAGTRRLAVPAPTRAVPVAAPGRRR